MFKIIYSAFLLLITISTLGQSNGDTKIVVTISDTINIIEKVKLALIKNDFIVKENGIKDTLSTYPAELKTMAGHAVVWAVIDKNIIELSGIYSLKKLNSFGITKPGKGSNNILYYRGSKTWKILESIASDLGGKLTYTK